MSRQLVLVLSLLTAVPLAAVGADDQAPSIIPQPEKMEIREGQFLLGPNTAIVCDGQTRQEAEYLAELLQTPTGFEVPIREASAAETTDCIVLRIASNRKELGEEGYELKALPNQIVIEAPTTAGVFYACQTLRQLLPAAVESECLTRGVQWQVPCVEIKDCPSLPVARPDARSGAQLPGCRVHQTLQSTQWRSTS